MKHTKFVGLAFASIVGCTNALAATTLNLPGYTLTGTYALPTPQNTAISLRPGGSLLAEEASAVTFNRDTNSLFVVGDGGRSVVQVSKTGALINSMTLPTGSSPQGTEFYDTEGLAYIGGNKFVLVEERYRQLSLFSYVAGGTLTRAATQTVDLGTNVGNTGLEGLSFDPSSGANSFILVNQQTGSNGSLQRIFKTDVNFATGSATNGSATTVNATPLFPSANLGFLNASSQPLDLSDVFALSNVQSFASNTFAGNVLVLSFPAGQIKEFTRAGALVGTLNLAGGAGTQPEGLTMDDLGNLYVVGEAGSGPLANQSTLFVYSPAALPEPQEYALMLAGLGLVGLASRRKKLKRTEK